MTAKTTFNPEARTVTLHFENSEVTMSYTTYRQLEVNGGYEARQETTVIPDFNALKLRIKRRYASGI